LFGKKTPSPKANELLANTEVSPIKQRLQHNLALYGNRAQEFDEYDEDEFDPWRFIAFLPPMPRRPFIKPCIPAKTCTKPTLVLDLDETLVHCSTNPDEVRNPHFMFEVEFNHQIYRVAARKRPGLDEFMEYARERFEVVIFTASQKVYADKILDLLDPRKEFVKHRVFRDDCVNVEGNYLKDLTVLGRDLGKTVIVDNSPQAFSYQLDNGLPILSWFDNDDDRELYKIIPLLEKLHASHDFRVVLKDHFKLYKKVQQKQKQMSWM
jgi:CTD small phosphatase-like protein 2